MVKIEKMSCQAAVNLGGLDGPALYTDSSGGLIQANEAAVILLGSAWRDVAELLVSQVAGRGDLDDAHHAILAYRAPDGTTRHFAVHSSRDEGGCMLLLIDEEVSSDLIPSARLEEILESISDCFFAVDGNGVFVFANSHAAEFLGVSRQQLLGRTLESLAPIDAQFAEARSRAMLDREPITYDSRLPDHDSWIEVRAYPAGDGMGVYFSDITSRMQAQEQLTHLAHHDALTGLPNRAYFQDQLRKAVAKSNRGVPSALLFLDMDRFKAVNDTVGHAAGDAVIIEFARVVGACAREEDTLARFGGDEFALLLENTSLDAAAVVAERIQTEVQGHEFAAGGRVFSLGVSIGLAPVQGTGGGGHVMALADSAMYEAKRLGGERTCTVTAPPQPPQGDVT